MSRLLRGKIADWTLLASLGEAAFGVVLILFAFGPATSMFSWLQDHTPVVTIAVCVWLGTLVTFGVSFAGIGKKRMWAVAISLMAILMIFFVLADAD